jgi:hypothetical protein
LFYGTGGTISGLIVVQNQIKSFGLLALKVNAKIEFVFFVQNENWELITD